MRKASNEHAATLTCSHVYPDRPTERVWQVQCGGCADQTLRKHPAAGPPEHSCLGGLSPVRRAALGEEEVILAPPSAELCIFPHALKKPVTWACSFHV